MNDTNRVMQSYGRCCASPRFFDDFYATFLASSPAIREKFARTDMTAQKQLLRAGILNLVLFARGMPDTKLRALGQSHSRAQLDIHTELMTCGSMPCSRPSGNTTRTCSRRTCRPGARC